MLPNQCRVTIYRDQVAADAIVALTRLHTTIIDRIAELLATGVNLTGVAIVLELQDTNVRLRADLDATPPGSDQERTERDSSTQPDGTPRRIASA